MGLLGPMDEAGLCFHGQTKLTDNVDPATVDAVDLIRRGTGLKDLDIVLPNGPSGCSPLVADRYSRDRVPSRRRLPPASAIRRLRDEYGNGDGVDRDGRWQDAWPRGGQVCCVL